MTDQWAICEILGHRRLVGLVSECELAGAGFFRIDVMDPEGGFKATMYVPPASVYCLTPTTEEEVRAEVERQKARPALMPYRYPVANDSADDEDDPYFEDPHEAVVPPSEDAELGENVAEVP